MQGLELAKRYYEEVGRPMLERDFPELLPRLAAGLVGEVISRLLGEWLDKEDFIEDSYILEVSSPGLGRPLKKEKDFARSIGKDVEIRLYKAIDKQKEFTGTLTSYDADSVTITMEDGSERTFEKSEIALIRLAFDF